MKVFPAKSINGTVNLPGDKSVSHRSAMFAAMADGETRITNYLTAEDCLSTIACLRQLGVKIERDCTSVVVHGVGKRGFSESVEPLDCGNSGTTIRLIAGILAGQTFDAVLTGDDSLAKRPMKRIIEPLRQMGAKVEAENDRLPIEISGGQWLHGVEHTLAVASAQVKSCILLAGLNAGGKTTVIEPTPTRDHTERMLSWLGAEINIIETERGRIISVDGSQRLTAKDIQVPSDVSSAAFFLVAAACLKKSDLTLKNVGLNPTRTGIIDVLKQFGVDVKIGNKIISCNEPVGDLIVKGGGLDDQSSSNNLLSGAIIANLIDEIPILAVLGTQLGGGLEVRDAAELRVKETDRIAAIVENLRRLNAVVTEFDDGFRVERSDLKGGVLDAFGDHRIAMAFAVAGQLARGETEIIGSECADISFPRFFETLGSVVW